MGMSNWLRQSFLCVSAPSHTAALLQPVAIAIKSRCRGEIRGMGGFLKIPFLKYINAHFFETNCKTWGMFEFFKSQCKTDKIDFFPRCNLLYQQSQHEADF